MLVEKSHLVWVLSFPLGKILKTLDQQCQRNRSKSIFLRVHVWLRTLPSEVVMGPGSVTMPRLGQQCRLEEALPCSPFLILHVHHLRDSFISRRPGLSLCLSLLEQNFSSQHHGHLGPDNPFLWGACLIQIVGYLAFTFTH